MEEFKKKLQRWTPQETEALSALRVKVGVALTDRLQHPEVVGDRKLLRFLRGHAFDLVRAQ